MKVTILQFDLELQHTFTISREARNVQPTIIVGLEQNGITGYGEVTSSTYYDMSRKGMLGILEGLKTVIEQYQMGTPEQFWAYMQPFLREFPFVQSALDIAVHDWYGKKLGQPLYRLWGLNTQNLPLSTYTIGIDTIEKMIEKLVEQPWPVYKIKLGTDRDLEIIRALRKHSKAPFRVDANCGWTVEETIRNSVELKRLGVQFIEQPMPKETKTRPAKKAFKHSHLPLIADESCQTEKDVATCLKKFSGINIKLMKCGGITPALRMIKKARALNLSVMLGCMTESSVGISAAAQLLPLVDYADLDGALLLKNDPADGAKLENGKMILPNRSGTGVVLK